MTPRTVVCSVSTMPTGPTVALYETAGASSFLKSPVDDTLTRSAQNILNPIQQTECTVKYLDSTNVDYPDRTDVE